MPRPRKPSPAQCGHGLSAKGVGPAEKPATAGTYKYSTKGTRALIGAKRRINKLPSQTVVIVTPIRKLAAGKILCYVIQRKYEAALGDTATLLIRGSDVYLRSARFQSSGYVKVLSPAQPLLSLSGSELKWQGEFRGPTSGQYASEIIGHKRVKVGTQTLEVAGVKTRLSYDGSVKGWQRSTSWVSTKGNLLVAENVTQERDFGLDRLRLSYVSHLKSLKPK